jgi:hypothetical protein
MRSSSGGCVVNNRLKPTPARWQGWLPGTGNCVSSELLLIDFNTWVDITQIQQGRIITRDRGWHLQFANFSLTLSLMIKPCLQSILLIVALAANGLIAQNPLEEIAEALEGQQMLRLAAQQNRRGITIDAFNSDGCSGGMSSAWSYLSDTLPEFVRYAGEKPPWEHCCVAHDRHYWRGASDDGFNKREQSDGQLRQCVKLTGRAQGEEISTLLGLPKQDIIELIDLTAELMYQAVRIGGAPCTGLPWRWGHGWPRCTDDTEIASHPL